MKAKLHGGMHDGTETTILEPVPEIMVANPVNPIFTSEAVTPLSTWDCYSRYVLFTFDASEAEYHHRHT